jgi:single-stranded DNA-binding protein
MTSNFVQIRGRIIKHEVRKTKSGTKLVEMTLVASNGGKDAGPQYWDLTKWAPDSLFLKGLERIEEKKVRAVVIGELRKSSWETNEGQKRSRAYILVDEVLPALSQPKERKRDDDEEDDRPRRSASTKKRKPRPEPEPEVDVDDLEDEDDDDDDDDAPF